MKKIYGTFAGAALALVLPTLPASALDIAPAGWVIMPEGTNLALMYYQYSDSTKLDIDGVGHVSGSELEASFAIGRYLHYGKIADMPVALDVFLPGGSLDLKVGGVDQRVKNGIGDLTVGVLAWPIRSSSPTGTTIGIGNYVTAPLGEFDANATNFASGTWTYTPQLAVIQGFGNGFWFDGAADVAFQANHRESGLDFSRDPSFQLQGYLRWNYTQASSVSFGYSGTFGGKSFVNDSYTGLKTANDELRFFATHFLTPTFQIQGMLATDLDVQGGFERDLYGQLRLLKIF